MEPIIFIYLLYQISRMYKYILFFKEDITKKCVLMPSKEYIPTTNKLKKGIH